MKKASIFILLMLLGIFGFSEAGMANYDRGVNYDVMLHFDSMDFNYESVAALHEASPQADCTITVKGVYKGSATEFTVTFQGISCAELIKQLMTR